ncbi:hypothetical protein [Verrucomicrobium sp. BvORR034]|uniref:hypothetical protein n=1 Tax=Verrucomicrobium sp. BvORR034 TaxID=1396418 RepID=UPI002240F127|nr:hypothetical protein [Verrucomicrobium sp. BvORR034]
MKFTSGAGAGSQSSAIPWLLAAGAGQTRTDLEAAVVFGNKREERQGGEAGDERDEASGLCWK